MCISRCDITPYSSTIIFYPIADIRSRTGSVGIKTMLWDKWPSNCSSIPGSGKTFFLLLKVYTGCDAHPGSYAIDTRGRGGTLPVVKRPGREANNSPTFLLTYLLTPWSRVLLEKLTSKNNSPTDILIRSNKMHQYAGIYLLQNHSVRVSGVYRTHHQEYIKV